MNHESRSKEPLVMRPLRAVEKLPMSTIVTIAAGVLVAATAVMNTKLDHIGLDRSSAVAGLAAAARDLRSAANALNAEFGRPVQLDEPGWQFVASDSGRDGDEKEGPGGDDDEDSRPAQANDVALPARRPEVIDEVLAVQDHDGSGDVLFTSTLNSAPVISRNPATNRVHKRAG